MIAEQWWQRACVLWAPSAAEGTQTRAEASTRSWVAEVLLQLYRLLCAVNSEEKSLLKVKLLLWQLVISACTLQPSPESEAIKRTGKFCGHRQCHKICSRGSGKTEGLTATTPKS